MRRSLLTCVLLAAICLAVPHRADEAHACATAKRKEDPQVAIATESALIVWDAKNRKQHFIRRASFETRAPYFGFLVPTPTQPVMKEVSNELFTDLEDWTKRKTETQFRFEDPPFGCSAEKAEKGKRGAVEVLASGHVAGLDYDVLKAKDPTELGKWLARHGYDWTASQEKWIEPYVKGGWIITAFQNKKDNEAAPHLSMQAVCMSFATDRPFFPYREPLEELPAEKDRDDRRDKKRERRSDRLLRVFFVADQRMDGKLDDEAHRWSGKAEWANPLTTTQRQQLEAKAKDSGVSFDEGAWLTVFDDDIDVRQDSDLHFSPSEDQSTLERRPIVKVVEFPFIGSCLCGCALIVGGPALLLLWIVFRRRRRTSGPL